MTLIDVFFNCVILYVLGSLLRLTPEDMTVYLRTAAVYFLVKTAVWLCLRVPLMLPIDRWERRGAPSDDNDPALIRAIYYFPFDFTLFYGALLGVFYSALVVWLVRGPLKMGEEVLLPGLMLAGSICAGAIAVGVPVNLMLTAKFSRRLAERKVSSFSLIPGKQLSLGAKMATIALALGCAPSLLLFSVQRFVQDHGLYEEAHRTARAVMKGLAKEDPSRFQNWVLSDRTNPFVVENGEVRFFGPAAPSAEAIAFISGGTPSEELLERVQRQQRYVIAIRRRGDSGAFGVLVGVPDPPNHWLAMSLVIMLACFWPLFTATLLVRTIVVPISFVASTFHRIIGRGRTEESDRVPIFYKDEVGRLAFNANRTIDILTEARQQLEVNAQSLSLKNQELKQAYRTKGEFLANMSHELRTPLNAIIGFSRLTKRKLGDTIPERQQRNLGLIEQSGEQLLALVNDLLDFEKIEAGKLVVRRQTVELGPFMESLESTLAPLASERGLGFEMDLEGIPSSVPSDKERLRQVLSNLLTNAIKYSDQGSVRLTARQVDDEIVFWIKDQGIGMSPEQLEKIFDPFHQVDATETRERGGVGLGLAIVSRLVKLLKGEITVSSQPGQGSEFEVRFPLVFPTVHLAPQGVGAELLVVDDNPDELETLHADLTEAGFRVLACSCGNDALEKLDTVRPLAVLLDIAMPEVDGWEVLRRLRASGRLEKLIVVVISADFEPPEDLLDVEVRRLPKPFEADDLARLLLPDRIASLGDGGLAIVEDDPHTAQLLEQVFAEASVTGCCYSGEEEALKAFSSSLPAVVVLDLTLAKGDGWSLLRRLRARPKGSEVAVVVYSAAELGESELAALEDQGAIWVPKQGRDSLARLVNAIVAASPKTGA